MPSVSDQAIIHSTYTHNSNCMTSLKVNTYSGTGVSRDTNRTDFVWEVCPDLTPPPSRVLSVTKMAWQSFVCTRKGDFGLVFRSLGTVFLSSYFLVVAHSTLAARCRHVVVFCVLGALQHVIVFRVGLFFCRDIRRLFLFSTFAGLFLFWGQCNM